jgi:hypothetical protein
MTGPVALPEDHRELERLLSLVAEFLAAGRTELEESADEQRRLRDDLDSVRGASEPHPFRGLRRMPQPAAELVRYALWSHEAAAGGFLAPLLHSVLESWAITHPSDDSAFSIYAFAGPALKLPPLSEPMSREDKWRAMQATWEMYQERRLASLEPFEDLARRLRDKLDPMTTQD